MKIHENDSIRELEKKNKTIKEYQPKFKEEYVMRGEKRKKIWHILYMRWYSDRERKDDEMTKMDIEYLSLIIKLNLEIVESKARDTIKRDKQWHKLLFTFGYWDFKVIADSLLPCSAFFSS